MPSSRLEEVAATLGLTRQEAGSFHGALDGFPVQLAAGLPGRSSSVLALLRYSSEGRAEAVAQALAGSADLAALGATSENVRSDGDSVVLTFPSSVLLSAAKSESIAPRVRAAVAALKSAVPDNRQVCTNCGAGGADPALFNGEVDRLCSSCVAEFERQIEVANAVYDQHPVNMARGFAAALAAGAGGAVLYGGIIIATDTMVWFIAILTGLWVGWFAVKAAGKVTLGVQAMAAAITVASVIAGLLIAIGYHIARQAESRGVAVDWLAVLRHVPELLAATAESAIFSLAGGVVGALYVFRTTRRPRFGVGRS